MLDVHPSACVGALIAFERGHPFRGVYHGGGEMEMRFKLSIEVGHELDKECKGIDRGVKGEMRTIIKRTSRVNGPLSPRYLSSTNRVDSGACKEDKEPSAPELFKGTSALGRQKERYVITHPLLDWNCDRILE